MKLSRQIFLAFSLVLTLSLVDSFTNYLLSVRVKDNIDFLNTSESVIRNSTRLHKAIIEMQSAFRGYLLTNDSSFLNVYNRGVKSIPSLFSEQEKIISEDRPQKVLLDSIHALHGQWILYADSLVEARKQFEVSASYRSTYDRLFENKLKKKIGKGLNDLITKKFARFDRNEYRIRNQRSDKLLLSIKFTHTSSFIFLSLTLIIGICSMFYIVRLISRRIASMVGLAENISRGDFSVVSDRRHDELTGLSTSLNIMSEKLSKNIHELERQNTELNRFAYVVSHDLKAPVRGIHNVIQWIQEDLGDQISPELKKYLDIIPQRTKRMEDLINGLLEYARTREKTVPEHVNMEELVRDIADALIPRSFILELYELPVLYAERIKLEQVFTNLISNSVKYTRRPDGHITITCLEFQHHYEFSVKDNGMGIAPEYHEKIFEIFQTLRERDEVESTGIGLAITKKIIDDQQGMIRVNSAVGEGAEFIFTWPKIR
jgi:signal transduction histidine kinase